MTNVNSLRHKRSGLRGGPISIPFPTSSSAFMHDQAGDVEGGKPVSRWSGENLTPNDGYSNLFTSGIFPGSQPTPSPTLSSFPSPPKTSPPRSPVKGSHFAPLSSYSPTTPARRRRSSIIHTTPSSASPRVVKASGMNGGVERALDNVMRSLKLVAMGTPRGKYNYDVPLGQESRWSSSSDGSVIGEGEEGDGGFWGKPRKSSETSRSRTTIKSAKSGKSKGRKSEESVRMDLDLDQAPEVPPVPMDLPNTPGRSRRMMNGLVKRLRMTPKKGRETPPAMPPPDYPPPSPPLPLPIPVERTVPRKSSLSTLRSVLTKKGSTTTLRSVRSTITAQHTFMSGLVPTPDCQTPPVPLPPGLPRPNRERDEVGDGCFPSTPGKGRLRTPKSSIGQPKLQHETSPSYFLIEMPRRAPETPKRESFDLDTYFAPTTPGNHTGAIRFETEVIEAVHTDEEMAEGREDGDETLDQTVIFTPEPPSRSSVDAMIRPASDLDSTNQSLSSLFALPNESTPILTAKAGRKANEDSVLKSKHLINLLPQHAHSYSSPQGQVTAALKGLRSKKSVESLKRSNPLKEKNLSLNLSTEVNSIGLPARPSGPRSVFRPSRKDPLGIIKRFNKFSQAAQGDENAMPYLSGAGDGWGTPLPTQNHKLGHNDLGTTESYFDVDTGKSDRNHRKSDEIKFRASFRPDFSAPPPPLITEGRASLEAEVSVEYPRAETRFEEGGFDWRITRGSETSMTSVSMTTGEGVEEWELERYLKDLEEDGDAGSKVEVV
ncbi:hypothetical protein IAR55_001954 [Kwoniella newhampshirensis]|uniref:Uncharacterized protein n=1 Tax=Kwoniella newhampshirensis TaxID=1651941 RepID=A0AAW0Z3L6_9TREE